MSICRLLAPLCLMIFLCGCGYRIGFIAHPQISSVAVAPVINETMLYNAAGNLRSLLCERVMTEGSFKLRRESTADCIIHARVISAEFSEISLTSDNNKAGSYLPDYYKVVVQVEYSVILPARATPLVPPTKITGEAMFDHMIDLETARQSGVKQALWDASKKIVDGISEAW